MPRPPAVAVHLVATVAIAAIALIAAITVHGGRADAQGPVVRAYEWQSDHTLSASQLLRLLDGLESIWRWDADTDRWQVFALTNDQPIPGATDFQITAGANLYFGNRPLPDQFDGIVLQDAGDRTGLIANRKQIGDPRATVTITDYSDFL